MSHSHYSPLMHQQLLENLNLSIMMALVQLVTPRYEEINDLIDRQGPDKCLPAFLVLIARDITEIDNSYPI
ncbi:hypothetical protein BKA93DRAFT_825431 [Sparassis latifolia]